MYISLAWAFKDDEAVKDKSHWRKRLNKQEFLKLPKATKERYIKLYPHSSHRFLMGGADTEKAENFPAVVGHKPMASQKLQVRNAGPSIHEKRREAAKVRTDIKNHNTANVAVINPQSLRALDSVKDSHLREASDKIVSNKTDIANTVQEQATRQPNMYRRGLETVDALVSGEKHPDELRTTEKHAMQNVLMGVATIAILGAGVLACSMAGAPLGALVGRVMFDMWAGSKHGKNMRDDVAELKRLREKRRKDERQAGYDAAIERSKATASASEHGATIDMIVDQVSDILKYHTASDFQLSRDEMFASASDARYDNAVALKYLMDLANCSNYEECGDGMLFDCNGDISKLHKLFQRMKYNTSSSVDGEFNAYHCENERARATFGCCGDRYYIRYEGDFNFR